MVETLQNTDEVIALATVRLELRSQLIMLQNHSVGGNQKRNLVQIGTIRFLDMLSY